jgi:hypothetical protein
VFEVLTGESEGRGFKNIVPLLCLAGGGDDGALDKARGTISQASAKPSSAATTFYCSLCSDTQDASTQTNVDIQAFRELSILQIGQSAVFAAPASSRLISRSPTALLVGIETRLPFPLHLPCPLPHPHILRTNHIETLNPLTQTLRRHLRQSQAVRK